MPSAVVRFFKQPCLERFYLSQEVAVVSPIALQSTVLRGAFRDGLRIHRKRVLG